MTIHKAGYILLLKILIVLIILNLASFYFINNTSIVYTILGITVVMYLLVVNFFRFPNRVIIQDDNTILAPADGKIVVIEETEEPEYFKDRRLYFYEHFQCTYQLVSRKRCDQVFQIPQRQFCSGLSTQILDRERTDYHRYRM